MPKHSLNLEKEQILPLAEHEFLPVHPGLLVAGGVVLQQQVIFIHQLLQLPLLGQAVWVVILVPALLQPCAECLDVWCWVRSGSQA